MSKVYINLSIISNNKSMNWDSCLKQRCSREVKSLHQSDIKSISRDSFLKQRCSREVKSLHQSVNRFKYQIIQPRQFFEITLFRRSQKFTSIRQSLPISNQSAKTVVWNNAVPEKSKVYINPSIASNIKSFIRDSCLKQRCCQKVKSLHQSVNRFQYQINQPRKFVWNNAVPEKSKVYINPSIASNMKSFSRDICLKQRCSRKVKSLHQSVNRFQYQINQPRKFVWNNAVPEKSKVYINPSVAFNMKSFSRDSCLKYCCSRKVKSLHQSVNRFQYEINQPRQLFETTLFPRSHIDSSIASNIKSISRECCLKQRTCWITWPVALYLDNLT